MRSPNSRPNASSKASGLPFTIVRPDTGVRAGRRSGAHDVPGLPAALSRWCRSSAPDAALQTTSLVRRRRAAACCCWQGAAIAHGKTYNFSGGYSHLDARVGQAVAAVPRCWPPPVALPLPCVCRVALLALLGAVAWRSPPLTSSAIAGIVNDANLDPSEAMRDLGYAPLGGTRRLSALRSPACKRRRAHLLPARRRSRKDNSDESAFTIQTVLLPSLCVTALHWLCASLSGAPPKGADEAPPAEAVAAMNDVGGKANGTIVWSELACWKPRPVHDEDRWLRGEADHQRR